MSGTVGLECSAFGGGLQGAGRLGPGSWITGTVGLGCGTVGLGLGLGCVTVGLGCPARGGGVKGDCALMGL